MAKYLVTVSIESLVEWMEDHQPEAAGLFLAAFADGMVELKGEKLPICDKCGKETLILNIVGHCEECVRAKWY